MKTRYAKPFESVQVKIPYESGMSPYSGLLDMIEKAELVKKEGNSLVYTTLDGEIIKKFRKGWEANTDGCLDKVMSEYGQKANVKISNTVETDEGEPTE
jgi:hypothetical protein